MGWFSRLTDKLIKPLMERTEYVSPNNAQPELARAAGVYKQGSLPPEEDEAQAIFLDTVELVKHHDPIAADIVRRQNLGSRSVGTMILDNVAGDDVDQCARVVLDAARRALTAEGHTGRFSVHPIAAEGGQQYFVVLFEPAPTGAGAAPDPRKR